MWNLHQVCTLWSRNFLSPPDVNVDHPDKKSIMMYVMCFFQVLPHSNIILDSDPETPSETVSQVSSPLLSSAPPDGKVCLCWPSSWVIEPWVYSLMLFSFQSVMSVSASSSSSRQSALGSLGSSLDLSAFNQSLEVVMTWLLRAEEVLGEQGEVGDNVQVVKEQFHQHEASESV